MVDGMPFVVVGTEGVSLFGVGGVGEQGAAVAGVLANLVPQGVANAGGRIAQEDTRRDFQEPAGEEATQTDRAVREDDDRHQMTPSRARASCVLTS